MEDEERGFTQEQLSIIAQLKDVLNRMEELNIHISAVTEYEVVLLKDYNGKPYISIL